MYLIRIILSFIIIFVCTNIIFAQSDTIFLCGTNPAELIDPGELRGVTYTLKILLVEFQDVHHKTPAYTFTNFNNLFFSSGIYVSPNMYSPDGQQVFGSMKDYYSIMSDGDFTLNGYVVNNDNNLDGIPDWLTLPNTKSNYDNNGFANWGSFLNSAISAALTAGLNITTNSTTKLAIIYAGHSYRGGSLNPHAGTYNYGGNSYHLYINGELFAAGAPYRSERSDAKFSEIGINMHEFGHILGMPDLGENGYFDAMNAGCFYGPLNRGACPTPFNPQTRFKKGWISLETISINHTYQSDYSLRDPEVFKITASNYSNYSWLIETRSFNSNMTIGSTSCYDYNYYIFRTFFPNNPLTQGVLVWKVVNNNWGTILHADGKEWPSWPQITQGVPFPGTGNVKVLSPWSDTRTTPSWVPNTKPSLNVGMEITNQGTGWYLIDLYVTNPEDASPSKPQNLTIVQSANHHPYLSWTANTEPDIDYYKIWKNEGNGWQYYASTASNSFEDGNENYCTLPPRFCTNARTVSYYVIAVDDDSYQSVASNTVSAFLIDGAPEKMVVNPNSTELIEYSLAQNYPNPFNPTTRIVYSIRENRFTSLRIYDILGREVATLVDEEKLAGSYSVEFNGSNLPSGIYFYRLTSGSYTNTKKLILLR